ncbi:MAG TPA: 4'-phosphopantetheinyl transferase superfamily protein [Pyrinomonadaceae bacterium]
MKRDEVSEVQTISDHNHLDENANHVGIGWCGLLSCRLQLAPVEVHLWQATLDDWLADNVRHLLSADEISRADRFHFAKDRNQFTAARGFLRTLLSVYLGIKPDELRFSYSEKGKPSLDELQRSEINFNLAHSQGLAIYALSHGRAVGVDLEYVREDLGGEKIAERFFSPREIEMLNSVPVELRKDAFFNCWTRKEAYIKARGEGLSMSLDGFDVSLAPGETAALLMNQKEPAEIARWTMRSLPVPSGYVGAMVVEGHDFKLRTFCLE